MNKAPSLTQRQLQILNILNLDKELSTSQLLQKIQHSSAKKLSQITLTRDLKILLDAGHIERTGKGRAICYRASERGTLLGPMDADIYFNTDAEKRVIRERFDFGLFDILKKNPVFEEGELERLTALDRDFREQRSGLSLTLIKREFERVTIELSWKSSAIEGNTYSLLETETLLKEGIKAKGKKVEEATMLLNHKSALDFIREHRLEFFPLTCAYVEKVHSILVENLGVSRNLRKTLVGITGTRYRPLDNEFQIRESMEQACQLINAKTDHFSRAFLAILLISYIQPFEDGNKRCARMIGNALLLAADSFPFTYRSVDETEYKKAILIFYERNNLALFKKIFLEQTEFTVKNYFRSK